jgi:predicted O-methyltransferase YrrM
MRVLTHLVLWRLGRAAAETQTTEAERACLRRHAVGRRRLAEVGVWHGVTSAVLRGAMAADGVLLAIDPFPKGRLGFSAQRYIARSEVARVRNGTVRWMRLTGAEAGRQLAARNEPLVELVFIDADHTYEGLRGDWEAWSPLVAPGGAVALHDSRSTPERPIDDAGSVRYTQEVVAHDQRFEQVEAVDSLTVWHRKERT